MGVDNSTLETHVNAQNDDRKNDWCNLDTLVKTATDLHEI